MIDKVILAARKFALKNAFEFGKCDAKAVAGKVIAEVPECKSDMKTAMQEINRVVAEINLLPKDIVEKELSQYEFAEKPKEEKKTLPELPGAEEGKIVMRMAPNPNGPMHIGHTRMAILNNEYVKKYGGTLILRFDDTDPKNESKLPMKEAYEWDKEDLLWLGVEFHKFFAASSRLQVYYDYFEKLVLQGGAYVCTCETEAWKKLVRFERKPCPCRDLPPQEQLDKWKKMLAWEYKQGQAVARVKTALDLPNPAIVDWPAFRIVDEPEHPMASPDVKVWPLLDFAGAIDDHDYETTHILRGKDLVDSENRQLELYRHFGWKYPRVIVYGKFLAEDFVISKSKISAGIRDGVYSGWDDPQLPTLRAFKRRGILPQAVRKFILDLGISQHEVNADLDILYAENRALVDEKARRAYFVENPIPIIVESKAQLDVEIKNHPSNALLGTRKYSIRQGENAFSITQADAGQLKEGEVLRLKALCPIKIISLGNPVKAEVVADEGQKTKIVHWVQNEKSLPAKILMDTGKVVSGTCESHCAELEEGAILQLERMFYARLDSKENGELKFYFAHK